MSPSKQAASDSESLLDMIDSILSPRQESSSSTLASSRDITTTTSKRSHTATSEASTTQLSDKCKRQKLADATSPDHPFELSSDGEASPRAALFVKEKHKSGHSEDDNNNVDQSDVEEHSLNTKHSDEGDSEEADNDVNSNSEPRIPATSDPEEDDSEESGNHAKSRSEERILATSDAEEDDSGDADDAAEQTDSKMSIATSDPDESESELGTDDPEEGDKYDRASPVGLGMTDYGPERYDVIEWFDDDEKGNFVRVEVDRIVQVFDRVEQTQATLMEAFAPLQQMRAEMVREDHDESEDEEERDNDAIAVTAVPLTEAVQGKDEEQPGDDEIAVTAMPLTKGVQDKDEEPADDDEEIAVSAKLFTKSMQAEYERMEIISQLATVSTEGEAVLVKQITISEDQEQQDKPSRSGKKSLLSEIRSSETTETGGARMSSKILFSSTSSQVAAIEDQEQQNKEDWERTKNSQDPLLKRIEYAERNFEEFVFPPAELQADGRSGAAEQRELGAHE
ncbi:hypothetical protein TI39_contig691g00001 [Zymoseptoria brevis]|uniref:Uncharacterized protein n=1 Tax=Zymoseptoria brevis TaxID=1047168 RepID=A0A0F4GGU0_9PEZI|nr:hypothetical protein TI39_contig691g00001 [Zymoseptoria brevis]